MSAGKIFKEGNVPCDGCTRCCHGDAVRILPTEDIHKWETQPHAIFKGALMLAHKSNGDCVYLDGGGCSIQDDKPQQCIEFDCRVLAKKITWTQARKLDAGGRLKIGVW